MTILHVIILAIIQGMAELLPVSSSAHVVVAEKLMGMNPISPSMTLLLVMLHTGTMFAVIVYFWRQWLRTYFESVENFKTVIVQLIWASVATAIIGYGLIEFIEKIVLHTKHAQVEQLFGRLDLIAPALAIVGVLILIAGLTENRTRPAQKEESSGLNMKQAGWIGVVQGSGAAVSRFFTLWLDHLDRHAAGCRQIPR